MLKRDLVKEEAHELAYSVVWREFSDYYSNGQCDYLSDELGQKLLVTLEEFIEREHERRERLLEESRREREVQVYG